MRFYHGTTRPKAMTIAEEGLREETYLTPILNLARGYGSYIVTIDIPRSWVVNGLVQDLGPEFIVTRPVPKSRIISIKRMKRYFPWIEAKKAHAEGRKYVYLE